MVFLAAAIIASPAGANDSSAAIGLGGLELRQNNEISLDKEELFISRHRITVRYRFTNTTDRDIETLVAFPLPVLPDGVNRASQGDRGYPDWDSLDFRTLVDGKPAALERIDVAMVGDRPVDTRLKELGWPVRWFDFDPSKSSLSFLERINHLPQAERDALIAEGLLTLYGTPGLPTIALLGRSDGRLMPAWTVTTNITRIQRFPAGRTITVEHSYDPINGGSVGGNLLRSGRKRRGVGTYYKRRFCVAGEFLAQFDRKVRKIRKAHRLESDYYLESLVGYVLKSGANWRGPIGDFRLVIDSEDPLTMASLCMPGFRRISPTQVEFHERNFKPDRDLDVLFVHWDGLN